MNKVIFTAVLAAVLLVPASYAQITRVQSGNGVDVEWTFEPEVYTRMGYNIDWNFFGMEGRAKIKIKNTIRKSNNEEFVVDNPGAVYARIEIEDLEIKYEVEAGEGFNSRVAAAEGGVGVSGSTGNIRQGLKISWDDINTTVYLGPVYLQLKSKEHEQVDYVESLSDMDFVTIRQDVLSPRSTGSYTGYGFDYVTINQSGVGTGYGTRESGTVTRSAVESRLYFNGSDINALPRYDQLAALKVGFKLPDIVDVGVGISTKWSFRSAPTQNRNPMAVSLSASLLAVPNLILRLNNSYIFGQFDRDILEEGNPISVGALVGYDIPLGTSGLIIAPRVGFDYAVENKARLGKAATLPTFTSGESFSDNSVGLTHSYEAAIGFNLIGNGSDERFIVQNGDDSEDDVLDMFDGDERFSDGLGLGLLYGSAPHRYFQSLDIPYVGVKLTYWDSEASDTTIGLVPGLRVGFIFNLNYALGVDKTLENVQVSGVADSSVQATIRPSLDLGLGVEGYYKFAFLKFKYGIISKFYNLTSERNDVFEGSGGGNTYNLTYDRYAYSNLMDLRLRFGIGVVDIVPNTEFEAMWESGDLLRDNSSSIRSSGYSADENFFTATSPTARRGHSLADPESAANFGYIYIGAKVKF